MLFLLFTYLTDISVKISENDRNIGHLVIPAIQQAICICIYRSGKWFLIAYEFGHYLLHPS